MKKNILSQTVMAKGNFSPQNQVSKRDNRKCRDYLRNVCHRGKRCKFVHETPYDNNDEFKFCHDFQNNKCKWPGCRFLHCTEDEEQHYRNTGELPLHIQRKLGKNGIDDQCDKPLCKDFFNGSCARVNCKFQHVKKDEVAHQLHFALDHKMLNIEDMIKVKEHFNIAENIHQPMENHFNHTEYVIQPSAEVLGPPDPKRRMMSNETVLHFEATPIIEQRSTQSITSNYFYPLLNRNEARVIVLEDENALLKKRINELQKQVNDLTATNEFLLDQNAQLRLSGGTRTANVTAVTVPAVTITNTGLPSQATTPQQMAVNAAVAAGALRTVTASVATVPVSIATVTPVSIAAVSMTPVSIPPPIVTVAQQTITMSGSGPQATNQQQPNSQQPASLPLSISGATAPMVSYPIMTQELRPVLQ